MPRPSDRPLAPDGAALTAIRPPDYLPSVGVAALLLAADHVVLADTFAFSRQGGHNRACIRTAAGTQWLSVPRHHAPIGTSLAAVGVVDDGWRRRHYHAVRTAYGMAPFYEHLAPELDALWAAPPPSLAALTVRATRWALGALGGTAPVVEASDLPGAPGTLPEAVRASGAAALVALDDSAPSDAARAGVPVRALRLDPAAAYRQVFPGFHAGLSVLDLLMNLGPDAAGWLRDATRWHEDEGR